MKKILAIVLALCTVLSLAGCAAGGLLLIYPGLVTDVIGLVLVGVVLLIQVVTKKAPKQIA